MPTYRRSIRIPYSKLPLRLASQMSRAAASPPARPAKPIAPGPGRMRMTSEPPSIPPSDVRVLLTLPVPPSINHQYATVNGRRLLTATGRSYKAQVGQLVWLTLNKRTGTNRPLFLSHLQSGFLCLSVHFYFTSALRRDVDGGLKIAQDAICESLGVNDNRIVETHLYKHVDKTNPRIEVTLSSALPLA